MAHALFSWVNNIKTAALTVSGSVAGLGPDQLQNDQGGTATAWRATGTSATLIIDSGSPATVWRAFCLARTNLTAAATLRWIVSAPDYSGLTFNTSAATGSNISAGVVAGFGQSVIVAPADVVGQQARLDISDPTNPDGFLSIALAHAGPAWSPLTNFGFDSTLGRDDQVDEATTRGGQEFPVFRYARRRWSVTLAGVRGSEVWPDVMELDRIGRMGGNMLFVPDPASADINRESVYGRFTPTADLTWPYQGADRRQYAAKITERL